MDFGYRQYFGTAIARPYVGASGGFVRVDKIRWIMRHYGYIASRRFCDEQVRGSGGTRICSSQSALRKRSITTASSSRSQGATAR